MRFGSSPAECAGLPDTPAPCLDFVPIGEYHDSMKKLCLLALIAILPGCGVGVGIGGFGFAVGIGAPPEAPASDDLPTGFRIDDATIAITVADDGTYTGTRTLARTVTAPAGVRHVQRATIDFDPETQRVTLVDASVTQPDGTRIAVTADNVFTAPSEQAQRTPHFARSRTTTVIFPQLRVGSRTHVTWRFEQRSPTPFGFTQVWRAPLAVPVTRATITLDVPDASPVRCAGFDVDIARERRGSRRRIVATLSDYRGHEPEYAQVVAEDVVPTFVASSVDAWETVGARFAEAWADRVVVTPDVEALAAEIVGDRTGLDAARAIYRWVCRNVHYVQVYLGTGDRSLPHPSTDVMRDRYGDCKDHYVLFAALLRARDIRCEPAFVRWKRSWRTLPLPTPLQFDHCVAYLPDFDVWANPTDPFADLGVLDQALSDQFVVVGTTDGRVARTPTARPDDNRYTCDHDVTIEPTGTVRGTSRIGATGRPATRFRARLARNADPAAVATSLLWRTSLGGIGDIQSSDPTDLDAPFTCSGAWVSPKALDVDDRIYLTTPTGVDFLTPDVARRFLSAAARTMPIVIGAVDVTRTFTIHLPDGYTAERVPPDRTRENAIGHYRSTVRVADDGTIAIRRHLRLARDVVSAADYGPLRALLRDLDRDARATIVLRRTAAP